MPTILLSLFCPEMAINAVNRKLKKTANEPMVATFTMPDGSTYVMKPVTIPPTDVDAVTLMHWRVQACIGEGIDGNNMFTTNLPEEDVVFSLVETLKEGKLIAIAEKMSAPSTLMLGGIKYTGVTMFPACNTDVLAGVAPALTATAILTQAAA